MGRTGCVGNRCKRIGTVLARGEKQRRIAWVCYLAAVFLTLCTKSAMAGDIATFVNLGFSAHGKTFAFGQHGVTDGLYQAYADIYVVDVESNRFVQGGVVRTTPTRETKGKRSMDVFLALQNRAQSLLQRADISALRLGRTLYVQAEDRMGEETLLFRDFKTNVEYVVVMHVERTTELGVSFYLTVEMTRPNGSKVSRVVGQRGYVRPGVKNYALKKVLINEQQDALIFVVEKHGYAPDGASVRYMVEACRL